MDQRAGAILEFWIDRVGPAGWYRSDAELDDEIRARFLQDWERGRDGGYDEWRCDARSCLALLVLLDQFPRNMFRGAAEAFATDLTALGVAQQALRAGHDGQVAFPERQFFYLPFMHAESLAHQERAVRLFLLADPEGDNLDHARAHRWVIREFGRFPYRNDALGRKTSVAEQGFLDDGGYGAALRAVTG